jgi:putative membrane protein
MKNSISLKNVLFHTFLMVATLFSLSSCSDTASEEAAKKGEAAKRTYVATNMATTLAMNKENDAQFLIAATKMDLENIKLGQLAQKNSLTTDIKVLGKMLAAAHAKSLDEIKTLALKKAMTIPTATSDTAQAVYKKLNAKLRFEFDKDYCDLVVNAHNNSIIEYEKISKNSTDSDIKEWATTSLVVLRTHLDQAIICQKKSEKMKYK